MRYNPAEIAWMTEFQIGHAIDELDAEADEMGYADDSNKATYKALTAELDRRDARQAEDAIARQKALR